MIKYNLNNINDWYFNSSDIIKVYRNGAVVFYKFDSEQGGYKVCFAVVDDITQYTDTEFEDVYDKATEKWYKLNNLNQYEQYGVYGSGRTITYYDGKLTVDDGYEYQYSGNSWVNVGEVSGSTATLPDVPFTLNYNAKNYDASTHTIPYTEGALNAIDAAITGTTANIIDHSSDGYIELTGSTSTTIRALVGTTNFSRSSSNPNITIVCKAYTPGSSTEGNILSNRNESYNWMYRHKSTQLRFHGQSEQGSIAVSNTEPNTCSVRIDSNRLLTYNNWTQNTTSSYSNFSYGSNSNGGALFSGYYSNTGEFWKGVFYWIYMSLNTLTDEQVQQVIDYNEGGGGQTEYPVYYDEKSAPLDNLTFNTLEDAEAYAYNNCVYDGMKATINGSKYYFDSDEGWVYIPEYYKVEDVTPGGASGWTISGSSTYNPDSSYYDDFGLETSWTSSSYKIAKVTIYGYDHFTYYLRTSGYSYNSYVVATNVDEISTPPSTMSYTSSSAITNTYNWNKSPKSDVNLSNYRRITYNNLDKTVEHTFYVYFYGRTYGSYVGNATILIPKEQTNENWEQVTFSASSNVTNTNKNLYIDGNNSSSGGTTHFYYRWMIGLPAGSHTSYTNYGNYNYCPNVTSSTFTSVAGEQRQVNYIYDNTSNKNLSFRLVDESGNALTPTHSLYYTVYRYNSCNYQSNQTIIFANSVYTVEFKEGGHFSLNNSSDRHYIYGYAPPTLGTTYYVDNYQSTFDITYTKLSDETVTITYTTYDPNDVEVPTFSTEITWPYSGGSIVTTAATSYNVPYTYSYTVKQTSDLFSASTQTYTAGQAARTINFVLYPNNREFATVADLEAYQYAWEGMAANVGDTNYKYKNGEWVEQTYNEYEYIRSANLATSYYTINTNFYPTTANTIEVKFEMVDRSIDWGDIVCWRYGSSWDDSAFRFQTVTSGYQAIVRTGSNNAVDYRPTIGANNVTVYTLPLSATSGTYSVDGGAAKTITYNYSTMVLPSQTAMHLFSNGGSGGDKAAVGKMYYVKVYDGSGNLVKHYVPSDYNGTPCFYEKIDGDYIMDTYTGSNHGTLTLGPQV